MVGFIPEYEVRYHEDKWSVGGGVVGVIPKIDVTYEFEKWILAVGLVGLVPKILVTYQERISKEGRCSADVYSDGEVGGSRDVDSKRA